MKTWTGIMCGTCGVEPKRMKEGRIAGRECVSCHGKRYQAKRTAYKERERRRAGCLTREQIAVRARERRAAHEALRAPHRLCPLGSKFVATDTTKKRLTKRANFIVWRALKKGRLIKPNACERCGTKATGYKLHAHHEDHSKPLEIQWLCSRCHQGRGGVHDPTLRRYESHTRRKSHATSVS
jgi:hypothetical protein